MKKIVLTALAAVGTLAATPALAAVIITSVQVRSANQVAGEKALQIAELQLFSGATNVARNGTASATSVYVNGPAVAANANDGNLSGAYPDIYHGNDYNGLDVFTLTLNAATSIDRISIYGRTDSCCKFRDIYSYTLLNGSTVVGGGTLDARDTSFATAAVPEPATWGLMLVGFGMMGFGMRRRKSTVRTSVRFA